MEGVDGKKAKDDKDEVKLTRKEKRAAIKAALAHYGPIFLMVLLCFSAAALLMLVWLR